MGRSRTTGTFASIALATLLATAGAAAPAVADEVAEGKKIAFDRKLGNCLACHMIDDGVSPGNIGPPLVAMKARFPDKEVLRAQIWDATETNPQTIMPPFGKHQMITDEQIDKIVAYLYTL